MKNPAIRAHAKLVVAQNWGKMIRMSLLIGVMSLLAIVGFLLAPAASFIYICGLNVGYTAALLNMCDGKPVKVTHVFSQLRRGVSSFGLVLWMGLKIFFWMLPGLAVVLVGAAISVMADSPDMMYFFMATGYVVMMVFVIRASYSYAMAPYIHADNSAMSAFDALNASKELMNGRRFRLFKLTIPYILILLAIMIVYTVILALCQRIEWLMILLAIVGYIAILIVSIWFSLLSTMAQACFYRLCDETVE